MKSEKVKHLDDNANGDFHVYILSSMNSRNRENKCNPVLQRRNIVG